MYPAAPAPVCHGGQVFSPMGCKVLNSPMGTPCNSLSQPQLTDMESLPPQLTFEAHQHMSQDEFLTFLTSPGVENLPGTIPLSVVANALCGKVEILGASGGGDTAVHLDAKLWYMANSKFGDVNEPITVNFIALLLYSAASPCGNLYFNKIITLVPSSNKCCCQHLNQVVHHLCLQLLVSTWREKPGRDKD
ncbi:hypothetical protein BS47DRAFT_1368052 [Hydnum rufescens UP504]|uniref:Uncharacterized protein n=1 Tax=Hydnum rufescens UP504 TaxID=1448309 RepID=A0A9P6AH71_9AGAM|nr:hypothetical protein BS47DRAFT_1368052 [Hydnum rufescens UP504]